jgi:hypothetical protein
MNSLASLLTVVLAVQSVAFDQPGSKAKPLSPAVVDLPMLFRGPEPAVEVIVNGKGPFLFAIDTGATDKARVDSSLLQVLGLHTTGTDIGDDGSGKNTIRVGTVLLDSLRVGGLEFRHIKAGTRDFNKIGLPHIDGLLTFDLFRDSLFTLDYPSKRVRLEPGELPGADGGEILALQRVHGHPAVEIMIGRERVVAELDSGNVAEGFLFPSSLAGRLSLATPPVNVGKGRTITHEFDLKEAQLVANIRLGGFEFTHPRITFPAPFPFPNIGSRVLSQFAITFDQKRKRVRFIEHKTNEPN